MGRLLPKVNIMRMEEWVFGLHIIENRKNRTKKENIKAIVQLAYG